MTLITVACSVCEVQHTRTLKQVNQRIKEQGAWRCYPCAVNARRADLVGKRFGRWLVTDFDGAVKNSEGDTRLMWHCVCDCGGVGVVSTNALRTGHTKSCGCLKSELDSTRTRTHGKSLSREYRIWCAMWTRCTNQNAAGYANYGGRGISICERWADFENFLQDIGNCPPEYSIERLDSNGNYCPENCKWADRITQARNTRRNRILTLDGVSKCLAEWASDLGIDQASLRERLSTWTLEKALTIPKGMTR